MTEKSAQAQQNQVAQLREPFVLATHAAKDQWRQLVGHVRTNGCSCVRARTRLVHAPGYLPACMAASLPDVCWVLA